MLRRRRYGSRRRKEAEVPAVLGQGAWFLQPQVHKLLGKLCHQGLLLISSFIFDCSDEVLLHCVVLGMLQLEKQFS